VGYRSQLKPVFRPASRARSIHTRESEGFSTDPCSLVEATAIVFIGDGRIRVTGPGDLSPSRANQDRDRDRM
jgi:hypothetical protein